MLNPICFEQVGFVLFAPQFFSINLGICSKIHYLCTVFILLPTEGER